MTYRHASTSATERTSQASEALLPAAADPAVPMRACCCPARPMVEVVMPPAPGRPHPVDLWLCGHHYNASRQALAAAGARIRSLTPATAEAGLAPAMTAIS